MCRSLRWRVTRSYINSVGAEVGLQSGTGARTLPVNRLALRAGEIAVGRRGVPVHVLDGGDAVIEEACRLRPAVRFWSPGRLVPML